MVHHVQQQVETGSGEDESLDKITAE